MAMEQLKKCTIVSIDEPSLRIEAVYNPAKIKIGKKVPWIRHKHPGGDVDFLEFTSGSNRTLSVELLFDGYEKNVNVESQYVNKLMDLMLATIAGNLHQKDDKKPESKVRPHLVMLVWGAGAPFRGVIESVDAEYSMFFPSGIPARASCSLTIVEVDLAQMKNKNLNAA